MLKSRIVVVGAGAFGGWTALSLLRAGYEVLLVDAWGPGNSRASSGGETRVIRSLYGPDRVYVEWVRDAYDLWTEFAEVVGEQVYRQIGKLWLFHADDAYARSSIPLANDCGLAIEQVARQEAQRRFRQFHFDDVASIYFEPRAGYLKARRGCQLVCEQFQREGGEFRIAKIRSCSITAERIDHLSVGDGGELMADQFVFACGPWLDNVVPDLGDRLVKPTRQEVYYFGTPPGTNQFNAPHCPVWLEFAERICYGIPSISGRGFKFADDTRGVPFDPDCDDRAPSAAKVEEARSHLAKRFPLMKDAPLIESRVCQYENSPDGHLLVDRHPVYENAWIVGGGSGHGYKLGPALGRYVSELIEAKTDRIEQFSFSRFASGRTATQFQHR